MSVSTRLRFFAHSKAEQSFKATGLAQNIEGKPGIPVKINGGKYGRECIERRT